ncbi:MAG: hypothetical protein DCF12_14645 [Snowella sp.]|jgi:threonine dehydratase|nr:MAG: hypothetical protein DCF12_14645 [Snowella sp.]
MSSHLNISVFHYRNHGANYGKIAIGMSVPSDAKSEWQAFWDNLGDPYCNESKNPVYKLLLESSEQSRSHIKT